MKQLLTGAIGALVIVCAIFTFGYSQGKKSVKLENFKEYHALQTELNDKDVALLEAQQERNELRDKEVVKYVTVYRDRIKDPVIAQCVRDSGLLDVYDATVSIGTR